MLSTSLSAQHNRLLKTQKKLNIIKKSLSEKTLSKRLDNIPI